MRKVLLLEKLSIRRILNNMLIVKQNTYPNVDLKQGDIVEWMYARKCYYLYKSPIKSTLLDKSYFASPNCNKDGIKPNGDYVKLVGIVAQVKSKGTLTTN